jgi:hypothetical protein
MESTLEKEISHLGQRYLAPNFIDKNEENSPSVTPNTKLIISEFNRALSCTKRDRSEEEGEEGEDDTDGWLIIG